MLSISRLLLLMCSMWMHSEITADLLHAKAAAAAVRDDSSSLTSPQLPPLLPSAVATESSPATTASSIASKPRPHLSWYSRHRYCYDPSLCPITFVSGDDLLFDCILTPHYIVM
jgi:hypothetical protein